MNLFIPMDELLLTESLNLFSKVSLVVSSFVGAVFAMRAVMLQVRVASSAEYGELLTDLLAYFGLTALYPYLIKLLMNAIFEIALKIGAQSVISRVDKRETYPMLKDLLGDWPVVEILAKIGDVTILALSQGFYSICIGLLIAIAPVVIFSSTVLKISNGVKEYFQILIAMALWPVLWNVLGVLGDSFTQHLLTSPFRTLIFGFVIYSLQLLSPVFCMFLFKSMSSTGAISQVIKLGRMK
ncbi:hypothetical protein ACLVWU_08665 [Bdellovibrio sp. HCB290]|uniref:hypothetical protein n=1 Tax=Bdellovibrio sp. HCB290 TaxID=3394356 RepID=UPI0039B43B8A